MSGLGRLLSPGMSVLKGRRGRNDPTAPSPVLAGLGEPETGPGGGIRQTRGMAMKRKRIAKLAALRGKLGGKS